MKQVHWYHWAGIGALMAAYIGAGFAFRVSAPDDTLYDIAAVGGCIAVVVFMVTYTLIGVYGGGAKWWTNTVGTCLMIFAGAKLASSGITAWAVLFHHGLIDTPWLAWLYVGGEWLSFLGIVGLCLIWVWSHEIRHSDEDPQKPAAEPVNS